MALRKEKPSKERILLMGPAGTGKTYAWLTIAKRAQQTKSDARFYALDSDSALDRMLEEEFPNLDNVEWEAVTDWPDYRKATDSFLGRLRPQDFLIVDMVSPAWPAVEENFIMEVYGKDPAEFYMEARKNMKKGGALDGYKDWGQINREYRSWFNPLFSKPICHFICTAAVDNISSESADKSTKVLFAPYGVKPRGQKHLAHAFHTVLLLGAKRPGEHVMTSVKDRGREAMVAQQYKDFAIEYLVKVAGWKM